MNTKQFGIIRERKPFLFFDIHDINEHGLISPILWCREGEFRLIPKAIIKNLIDNAEMYAKLASKTIHPQLQFMWDQGIPISNQAGRILFGE